MNETTNFEDSYAAGAVGNSQFTEELEVYCVYTVECRAPDGRLKFRETFRNLVTTAGKVDILSKYFEGSGYTAAWYVGLIDSVSYTTGPAVGDTLASHGGWAELTTYTGDRKALNVSGSGTTNPLESSNNPAVFVLSATKTIKGCFLASVATGTGGTLFSAGTFTGGDKGPLDSGDTLNVSVSIQAS